MSADAVFSDDAGHHIGGGLGAAGNVEGSLERETVDPGAEVSGHCNGSVKKVDRQARLALFPRLSGDRSGTSRYV